MALAKKKLGFRPGTARMVAAAFLLLGSALAAFDAPQYFSEVTGYRLPVTINFPYRLGLDIQGGAHLVYQAEVENISPGERSDSMEAVRNVIERRVNLFGVAEPVVQVERAHPLFAGEARPRGAAGEEWRLIVELAGVPDINAAIQLIGETPFLEFREEARSEDSLDFKPTALTGRFVKKATLDFDPTSNQPLVNLELTSEGGEIFAELTQRNVGKQLAIFLDNAPISAPVVREEIRDGKAQISGGFTPQEAKELVGRLNAGALPVPIKLIAQQTVGPSLGQESLVKSIQAGIYGFLAVALFMIFWYRLPGVLAVLALILYAAIVLAIFKLIPVTLTVAGIGGFILSVGMAVDANVLIFERLKEELRKGKMLEEAIGEGFGRAWTSIRDSNVSSLITSAILYWMGTSVVQGFALTLSIGILVSMFSAIWITRTLLIAVRLRRSTSWRFLFLSGISK